MWANKNIYPYVHRCEQKINNLLYRIYLCKSLWDKACIILSVTSVGTTFCFIVYHMNAWFVIYQRLLFPFSSSDGRRYSLYNTYTSCWKNNKIMIMREISFNYSIRCRQDTCCISAWRADNVNYALSGAATAIVLHQYGRTAIRKILILYVLTI